MPEIVCEVLGDGAGLTGDVNVLVVAWIIGFQPLVVLVVLERQRLPVDVASLVTPLVVSNQLGVPDLGRGGEEEHLAPLCCLSQANRVLLLERRDDDRSEQDAFLKRLGEEEPDVDEKIVWLPEDTGIWEQVILGPRRGGLSKTENRCEAENA